jgi:hypothetical protein
MRAVRASFSIKDLMKLRLLLGSRPSTAIGAMLICAEFRNEKCARFFN